MSSKFEFKILAKDNNARMGELNTTHGKVKTPVFMPVGTLGSVKALTVDLLDKTGSNIILANTYHLMLRPGVEIIESLNGLRNFMNWKGPILTDSGGFQVMSLSKLRKLKEEGVSFKSHLDGSIHELTPEKVINIQKILDSTISMPLDECPPFPIDEGGALKSMKLSMRWAEKSKEVYEEREGYGLFGITQGSIYPDLREESASILSNIGFDGYALGGLAVGEGQDRMFKVTDETVPYLTWDKPRYLMGVGMPLDIIGAVKRGIDMFDCVLPTRSGRTGKAFTKFGAVNIRNSRHRKDPRPLDESIDCDASRNYSRSYLHHLVRSNEILGSILLTWHNITFYQSLMSDLRKAIQTNTLIEFSRLFEINWNRGDIEQL